MKAIKEIREELEALSGEQFIQAMEAYAGDSRKGVQSLLVRLGKREEALGRERDRVEAMCTFEKQYAAYSAICGIDEAGRGPLAGPVVAAAVILPRDCRILYINDSKQVSAKKREELYGEIQDQALAVGVGRIEPARIDQINILQATYEAMCQAIDQLKIQPDLLLNDAVTIPGIAIPQVPIIKGDAKSQSIAAASIVAKVTRDRWMEEYHLQMPQYDFGNNKGYGTAAHIEALKKYGPSPIHRRSFLGGLSLAGGGAG